MNLRKVDPSEVERIVGHARHATLHLARADTTTGVCTVLHSQECVDSGIDQLECDYSKGLAGGWWEAWAGFENRPVAVKVTVEPYDAWLTPVEIEEATQ